MEKDDFSKTIVVFAFITVLAYVAIVLYFSWHDRLVPDSLTYSFFAAIVGEFSVLGWIKVSKNKVEQAKEAGKEWKNENKSIGS